MREIKLRVWDSRNKLMLSPDEGVDNNLSMPCCDYNYDCAEYLQYTGIIDNNGIEIYEGDIVKFVALLNDHNQRGAITKTSIVYDWGRFVLSITKVPLYPFIIGHTYEVIGNIYENPELLEA